MDDYKTYLIFRKFFFWLIFMVFIVASPITIFYSLGYKFDSAAKKFLKTGAIAIRTSPDKAQIYLNEERLKELTPSVIRELIPKEYAITLKKEGFHPYKIAVGVKPSSIERLDIVLVPKISGIKNFETGLNIFNFFRLKRLLSENILVFTDNGIYLLNQNFEIDKRLTSESLSESLSYSIEGLKESNNRIAFWNKDTVWFLNASEDSQEIEPQITPVYKAKQPIKDVSFGLEQHYLIIAEGLKIIALDIKNFDTIFPILTLQSNRTKVFYDSESDILYIQDKVPKTDEFSFYKIELGSILHGKKQD